MPTVNFSVPDEVKQAFDRTFRGRNKSALVSNLMAGAVEAEKRRRRRSRALEGLLALRTRVSPASDAEIRRARERARA